MLSCRAHFHCLAGFRDAFISASALLFSVKKQMRVKILNGEASLLLKLFFHVVVVHWLYVVRVMPNSHQARSQRVELGLPLPWIFHIILPYSLEPREKGFPHAHDAHTHTDTLLTLYLASLAKIRVELGVRGLEHTRGGEDWCQLLRDSPLKILATSLIRTNATKLFCGVVASRWVLIGHYTGVRERHKGSDVPSCRSELVDKERVSFSEWFTDLCVWPQ